MTVCQKSTFPTVFSLWPPEVTFAWSVTGLETFPSGLMIAKGPWNIITVQMFAMFVVLGFEPRTSYRQGRLYSRGRSAREASPGPGKCLMKAQRGQCGTRHLQGELLCIWVVVPTQQDVEATTAWFPVLLEPVSPPDPQHPLGGPCRLSVY